MRAGLLFDGIGGFPLAFRRAGIDNVWSVEIDGPCTHILRRHFPEVAHFSDVARIGPWIEKKYGKVDVIAGGFPCQDLSIAGHRAGLDGPRSRLWWEFHRVLEEQRPAWCIIENVAGLLSSNSGRDMGSLLWALGDLGYGFAYRVLDAQGFGVPQRRRRVFVVGHLGDHAGPAAVLLEPESGGGYLAPRGPSQTVASALTRNGVGAGGGADDNAGQANHLVPDVAGALTNRIDRGGVNSEGRDGHLIPHRTGTLAASTMSRQDNIAVEEGFFIPHHESIAFHLTQDPISGDVAPAMGTGNKQGHATVGVASGVHADQRGEVRTSTVAGALQTSRSASQFEGVYDGLEVRRLTPRECERLQGFPDDWTDGQADSHRYRQLGNAVAVPVVEWIARRLRAYEEGWRP